MKSLKELQKEYDALDDDANDWQVFNKSYAIQRATLSEEFKGVVLPEFEPLVKECIEKAPESFYILLHTGQKFVYYSSKARLVPMYDKGKKGKKIYLPPHNFMKYFSFLKTGSNGI